MRSTTQRFLHLQTKRSCIKLSGDIGYCILEESAIFWKMFRLMILMGMGLGALYMMHLLAQDYNKLRKPVAAAARVLASASASVMRGKREAAVNNNDDGDGDKPPSSSSSPVYTNGTAINIDWKRIISRDPFECLQSLICQLMSGAENNSTEAIMLIDFIESTLNVAPEKIGRAFSRGLALRGATDRCYDEYFCLYSAKTMLRVLRWFSDSGYAD